MKKNYILILLLTVNTSLSFGQISNKRVYEISVINHPQRIELIESKNGQYTGNLITKVSKGKWRTGWLNRTWKNIWNIDPKEIIDKSLITETVVKKLMTELEENGIETIKKCSDDEKCNQNIYLDSGNVGFKIKTPSIEREYGFEEIYPLSENNKEQIELRIKAQYLITILYKHIDLTQEFSDLFKRLPNGYYHWYKPSGHSILTIKNRKKKK